MFTWLYVCVCVCKLLRLLCQQGVEVENPEGGASDTEEKGPVNDDEGSGTDEEEPEMISVDEEEWFTCSENEDEEEGGRPDGSFHNSSRLLRKDELLEMFKAVHNGPTCKEGQLTVGLVSPSVQRHCKKLMLTNGG